MRLFFSLSILFAISLNTYGQVPDYVPSDGLVAWYPFNGNANDESGNGNDGVQENVTLESDRYAVENAAFGFDGVNCCGQPDDLIQRITIESEFLNLGEDFSISCWFKSENINKFQQCLFNSIPHTGFVIELNNEHAPDVVTIDLGPGDAYWDILYAHGPKNDYLENEWYQAVFIKEGTSYSFFINGTLDWSESYSFSLNYSLNVGLTIGSIGGGHQIFNGVLDDYGIWNRALTETEIQVLYTAEIPNPGCTDSTACNFNQDADADDGSCTPSGCLEVSACNYNSEAECEGEDCDYSCCPGPGCCLDGQTWDWDQMGCVITNPTDTNLDGCTDLNDLMDILSAYGDCAVPEIILGCMDDTALNFIPEATEDDGTCEYIFQPNEADELVFEYYLNFTSSSSCTTPYLELGEYYLEFSGTYCYGSCWGGNVTDAAFNLNSPYAENPSVPSQVCHWTWNEHCPQGDTSCASFRPTPDVYNPDHIYYYPFTSYGGAENIYGISDECCWGDNSGGLTVRVLKIVN